MSRLRILASLAGLLLVLIAAFAIHAFQPKFQSVQPAPKPNVAARAVIALDPTPRAAASKPEPVKGIVPLPHSGHILDLVASPIKNELLVQSQSTDGQDPEDDPYGGVLYFVNLAGAQPSAQEIVTGNNILNGSRPVWDPKGSVAYFAYDNGSCAPMMGSSVCGIFTFDPQTGKVAQFLADATIGLAISPDGSLLAFWDFTLGDKLTVLDLRTKTVIKSWGDQVHAAADSVLSDIAFMPDGKSLLANTYGTKEIPLKQFDLLTGEVRTLSSYGRSPVTAKDALYFVQFGSASSESPRSEILVKISPDNPEPRKVSEMLPGYGISAGGNRRWLVLAQSWSGVQIFDARSQSIQVTERNCSSAVVLADGKIIYAVRGQLVSDPAARASNAPLPTQ